MYRVLPPLVAGIAALSFGFHSLNASDDRPLKVDTSNWGEAELIQPIEPELVEAIEFSNDEALVAIERSEMFAQFAPEPVLDLIDRTETGSLSKPQPEKQNSDLIKRIGIFLDGLDQNGLSNDSKRL